LDWDEKQGLLMTRLDICDNTNLYSDVYQFDLNTKKLTRLSDCQRLSKAIWSQGVQGFYAIKNEGSKQTLVKVINKKITTISKFELWDVIGAFDVSQNDAKIVASVKRQQTGWNLEVLNLQNQQWQQITQSQYKEHNPKFAQNFIYYVADNKTQQQVELYRLNLESNTKEQLTNSLGFVIDFEVVNDGILIQYYSAKNEQIHYLKNLDVFAKSNNSQSQKELDLITNQNDFKPFRI
jgi:Tol biopolymer transport system component